MKILQIETFYDKYVADFYARNPALIQAPYEAQIRALLQDGFSASHMMAPYMAPLGYQGMLVIANCGPAQAQWAREHGFPAPRDPREMLAVTARQVDSFRPDILYITDATLYDGRFLRMLKERPRLVVGWRAANIPPSTDWTDFDLMLSSDEVFRRRAHELGVRDTAFFRPGFPSFLAEALAGQPKEWDVVFSGQISPEHKHRLECLQALGRAVEAGLPATLGYFLAARDAERLPEEVRKHDHGSVWGSQMYRTLRGGRIVLNTHIDLVTTPAQNMRLFEATGAGSFVLTEASEALGALFEPGREVETYASTGEMIEKIRHYLAHPEEREAIARRGQERCLAEHSVEARVRLLDGLVRGALVAGRPADDAPRLVALAGEHVRQNRLGDAETVLNHLLARQPERPEALQLLGVVRHRTGKEEEGIALVQRAIQGAPASWPFHVNLATMLRSAGRLPEAEEEYRAALAINPDLPEARYHLGNLLRVRGAAHEAADQYRRVLELRPDHAQAAAALADIQAVAPAAVPGVRHFCTYFDSGYAARGLAMMESLLALMPAARIHVLCMDERAARIVRERQPAADVVTLEALEAFDPQLAATRADRSTVEYYFTCTPCLPRYVLARHPDADSVTYLDADLFFYESPERVFEEIGGASIAIVPHRFSAAVASRVRYGVYNVAWVTWRNNAEGRRCLEDYRTDCLAWCYDRLEDGKFADQKYLDSWPQRYRSVHSIAGKGMNLAPWNVDNYTFRMEGERLLVDGEPLVFYHFHGLKQVGPQTWDTGLRHYGVANSQPLGERLYRPYITRLNVLFADLAQAYGLPVPGDLRFGKDAKRDAAPPAAPAPVPAPAPAPAPAAVEISAGYSVIDRARAVALGDDTAWNFADVGDRQDTAYDGLLARMRAGQPRTDFAVAAKAVEATGLAEPTLLEVGCASGYYSEVFDHLLKGRVRYSGVDLSGALIDIAKRRRPALRFQTADATRLPFADGSVDIVFNGVALMHIVDYEAAIAESRRVARRFCIFHTVPVLTRRPTTFLQKAAYGRPVAEVILNEAELRLLLARHGLAVRGVWNSIPYDLSPVLGEPTPTRTYLCEVVDRVDPQRPALLNVGCGGHFHQDWVNVDIAPRSPAVLAQNVVAEPLRFPDGTFDAVYHSHVLEHLPKQKAPDFLRECLRVLKPGGVLRVVVPDLEGICREYVRLVQAAAAGESGAADRYDWILLELLDQMVRNESGGEMIRFLRRDPLPAEPYVIDRVGREAKGIIAQVRRQGAPPAGAPVRTPEAEEIGRFRLSGEVHQWMYDRFSLRRLLEAVGFEGCCVVGASDSGIPHFAAYGLDVEADGAVRKPDSMFLEARKPGA